MRGLVRGAALIGALVLGAVPAAACDGDCDDDGTVGVAELMVAVRIALGETDTSACPAADADGDGRVGVPELVRAVARALDGCAYPLDRVLRLNHIQVLGTHNSYHLQPREPLFSEILRFAPQAAMAWEYEHRPLPEQFEELGIRQIELDVFADPEGGLYAHRAALAALGLDPFSDDPRMYDPGYKVLHVQDIDFESTCPTLVSCLEEVKEWSDRHPRHVPIMILIEAKDDEIPMFFPDVKVPVPIGAAELDRLDQEILSVFPEDRIITPDEVRDGFDALEEAVRERGWPALGAVRGRVLFALDNEGGKKAAYIDGHPSLRGRVLFTSSAPGEPEAAFVKRNDPEAGFDEIRELAAAGFIVRTRADADTVQARSGDTTQRDAALASAAHFVSTDYPEPNPAFGTGYVVRIPDGMPAGCNPVSAPDECTALDVENPEALGG